MSKAQDQATKLKLWLIFNGWLQSTRAHGSSDIFHKAVEVPCGWPYRSKSMGIMQLRPIGFTMSTLLINNTHVVVSFAYASKNLEIERGVLADIVLGTEVIEIGNLLLSRYSIHHKDLPPCQK